MDKLGNILKKTGDYKYIIPKSFREGMRVPGLIYASEKLLSEIEKDQTYIQIANVATLPGIVKYSIGMPDIHWGYGLPIGGVAAVRESDGVISPGGVGSDINCGVRLLKTGLKVEDVKRSIEKIVEKIFDRIPVGIGQHSDIRLSNSELGEVVRKGSGWAVERGWGIEEDIENTEDGGCLDGADIENLSDVAIRRGLKQLGTLGAGNHFLEIQRVDEVYSKEIADKFKIFKGDVTIMIHTGSRGFGYQVCEDYMQLMQTVVKKYDINLPDRQLAAAPVKSSEGQRYISAMAAAANYAWANRQIIMHRIREILREIFGESTDLELLYDVAHNIAKFERHNVDGQEMDLCIHRKGATRAFPPGASGLKPLYQETGQPVIIPGDMGTESFLLVGTRQAMEESFGTVCHGAGRVMSRRKAVKTAQGRDIYGELRSKGILLKAKGWRTVAEEIPDAYKDVEEVVNVVVNTGLALKVARFKPIGVIKG